jgi:hypothetical protein
MGMPIISPIIYSNSVHHHNPNEGKQVAAFWIALHIFPLIFIAISFILNLIKRDKYYDIFEENDVAWLSLLVLFAADLLGLISYYIYKIL